MGDNGDNGDIGDTDVIGDTDNVGDTDDIGDFGDKGDNDDIGDSGDTGDNGDVVCGGEKESVLAATLRNKTMMSINAGRVVFTVEVLYIIFISAVLGIAIKIVCFVYWRFLSRRIKIDNHTVK